MTTVIWPQKRKQLGNIIDYTYFDEGNRPVGPVYRCEIPQNHNRPLLETDNIYTSTRRGCFFPKIKRVKMIIRVLDYK